MAIDTPIQVGDGQVTGSGTPNCASILICSIGGSAPRTAPCSPPDSAIGTGATGANGQLDIPVTPLAGNECIYVFDTCANRVSPVACVRVAAPAPAMSALVLAVAVGLLSLVGLNRIRPRT